MGRPKGSANKKTEALADLAAKIGVHPFEILCRFAANDWKGLGMVPIREAIPNETGAATSKREFRDISPISSDLRIHAAKEACKYLYPQRKAIEHSSDATGFKIVIEDFVSKVSK